MQEDELYPNTIYCKYFIANGCIKIQYKLLAIKKQLIPNQNIQLLFPSLFLVKTRLLFFFVTVIIVAVKIYDE